MGSSSVRTQREPILRAGDLIDDRELVTADRDRLDHDRVADELVDLVTTVEMPTNIALYGPWGSGKSGIANLMRTKLKDDKKKYKGVRFARFDAFKYAENPLRRNFIAAVATELDIEDDKYGKDLYAGKTKTNIDVPNRSKVEIAGYFITLTVVLIVALVAVIAGLTLLQPGHWRTNFGKNFSAALPASLFSPVLLAVVFTLIGKTLTMDRSVERPDSVEQFEDLFKDLVAESKASRLVIFVDELDRCTAKEVVTTLDAIRTFLGVDKCVFVVAADQHVLEQALSEEARQETPKDSVNPYYSTGSAYLDKVFQYQVSLPPLLPQSVTEFAIKAVLNNGGLWEELAPIDYVVSILIPSHVTSPRRVKHLLNTFALTYRLAESKHAAGRLQENPRESAQSIARLVCLRVEFPNFARDLTLDPHMPAHVLTLIDDRDADLGDRVAPHVRERALSYATGEASPARLLTEADPDDSDDEDTELVDDEEVTDDPKNARANESADSGARAQQGRQLITYLTRTRLIDGPSRDLIYLHSVGSVYGVPDDMASDLKLALENGQFAETHRLYRDADPTVQPKIVQYIAGQIGATYGIERLNAAHALLDLAQRETLPSLNDVADIAGQAIAEMHRSREPVLDAETAPGAWIIASTSNGDGASTLRRTLLEHLNARTDWDGSYLYRNPLTALNTEPDSATRVMARELISVRAPQVVSALKSLEHQHAHRVLNSISTQAGSNLAALIKQRDTHQQEVEAAAQEAAAAGVEETTTTSPEPPAGAVIAALTDLATFWADDHPDLSWLVAQILLLGNHQDIRVAVLGLLPTIGQTHEPSVAKDMLRSVTPRPVEDWNTWLGTIPASLIDDDADALLAVAANALFKKATGDEDDVTTDDVKQAVEQVTRLVESRPPNTIDLTTNAVAVVEEPVTTDAEAVTRKWSLNRIQVFAAAGLLDPAAVAAQEIDNLRQTLQTSIVLQADTAHLTTYIATQGSTATAALRDPDEDTAEVILALAQEAQQTTWLSERMRTQICVSVLAAAHESIRDQAQELAPATDELLTFVETHGHDAAVTVTNWVRLTGPDRATTQRVLQSLRDNGGITEDTATAFAQNSHTWSEDERLALAVHFIGEPDQAIPEGTVLRAIGFDRLDPNTLAPVLVKRFQASGSNPAKETVTTLWDMSPTGDDQAQQFYADILMPWLRANTQGSTNADAVRRALHVARNSNTPVPTDLRDAFADLVTEATDGDNDLTKAAIPALEALGYDAGRTGIFHKRLEVHDRHED